MVYPRDAGGHGIPLIAVHTDKGLTGWGEAQASRVPEAVCEVVCDLLNPALRDRPFHGDSRLSKVTRAPLAVGEAYHTHYELAPFFHELAVGVLQPDLGRCGITEALRMAEMARKHGAPVVVRVGESLGPQLAAALQFAALEPDRKVEYNPGRLNRANAVLSTAIQWKNGKYKVPTAPGLGIQMDEPEIHLMETQVA